MDVSLSELGEMVMDREAWRARFMGSQRVGHDWATELNWTELNLVSLFATEFSSSLFGFHSDTIQFLEVIYFNIFAAAAAKSL